METYKITTLLMLVIICILSLIKEGLGIECYNCNSKIHPECVNFASLTDEQKKPYIVKCWQLEGAKTKNYTMCRRIKQDIEDETRTIRQCATTNNVGNRCYKKTGTRKIKMEYCECEDDLCNLASPKLRLPHEVLFTVLTVVVVLIGYT